MVHKRNPIYIMVKGEHENRISKLWLNPLNQDQKKFHGSYYTNIPQIPRHLILSGILKFNQDTWLYPGIFTLSKTLDFI